MKVENRTPDTVHIGRKTILPGETTEITQTAYMWIESIKGGAVVTTEKGEIKIDNYGLISVSERHKGLVVE